MSFANLQKTILAQAQEQAAQVSAKHTAHLDAEQQRIKLNAAKLEEEIIRAHETSAEQQINRTRQTRQLAAKAAVLTAKQEELDAVSRELIDQLLNLDAQKTKGLLTSLLKLVPQDDQASITVGVVHEDVLRPLAKHRDIKVLATTIPQDGGFIWSAKSSEINLTIHHLVKRMFSRHRAELASQLFNH